MSNESPLIPLAESAKAYGVGRETMARMIREGWVPEAHRVGRRYVINRAAFLKWMRGEYTGPTRHPFIVRRPLVGDAP